MAYRNAWIYKWNSRGRFHEGKGRDWKEVFESGMEFTGYGFDNPVGRRLIGEVRSGDLVVAYQTNQRAAIGICRVVALQLDSDPRIRFMPLRMFAMPVKLHDLKRSNAHLADVEALRQGPVQSLYRLTSDEAITVLRACGLDESEVRSMLSEPVIT